MHFHLEIYATLRLMASFHNDIHGRCNKSVPSCGNKAQPRIRIKGIYRSGFVIITRRLLLVRASRLNIGMQPPAEILLLDRSLNILLNKETGMPLKASADSRIDAHLFQRDGVFVMTRPN